MTIPALEKKLKINPEGYWIKRGRVSALKLFRQMAQRVPAYKDFLKKRKIRPSSIKSIKDFKNIPPVDKDSYLRKYPLEKLCWDGKLNDAQMTFSTTSGSTGEPYYFPRSSAQDEQYALTAELYLRENFRIHERSTLYIDSFAMGAWIGGLFTYEAVNIIANRGKYPLSIITPGIFKEEILKAVKNIGSKYGQIIIAGYPPFVKDTIDDGISFGIDWKEYDLGFIFSAEGFTEEFRDYIAAKANLKNVCRDTLNHYGTVDLGTMSHETPISIFLRRQFSHKLFKREDKLPTFTQYIPEMFYFEEEDGGLICSAYSGLPLVRYDLKDQGGIISFEDAIRHTSKKELKKSEIAGTIWNLPFVYVYERKDFVVKLYGANIYPETVRKALLDRDLQGSITGKFTMIIKFDKKQNQYMELNVELRRSAGESEALKRKVTDTVVGKLLEENSEYRSNYKSAPKRQIPEIIFWDYEDPTYFKPGVKQKWVKKSQ